MGRKGGAGVADGVEVAGKMSILLLVEVTNGVTDRVLAVVTAAVGLITRGLLFGPAVGWIQPLRRRS